MVNHDEPEKGETKSSPKLRVSDLPGIIDKLERIYRNTDPEDLHTEVDLLQLLD